MSCVVASLTIEGLRLGSPFLRMGVARTFSVNVLGCFILGFINALALKNSPFPPAVHLALTTGFCGSFTTFSTFICESAKIAEQGKFSTILYACLSLVFGFLAFFLANQIVKKFM